MTYASATLSDFRDWFEMVRFVAVSDEHVEQALSDAENHASQSWLSETDYQRGQMLYAAHTLTLAGLGAGAEAEVFANGMEGFTSIKSGGLSLTRSAKDQSGPETAKTSFGRRYLEIAKRNNLGPRVTGS